MLLAVGNLGVTTCPPSFEMSLPLLLEIRSPTVAVLRISHGPQYVSSAARLPGGVNLPVTWKIHNPGLLIAPTGIAIFMYFVTEADLQGSKLPSQACVLGANVQSESECINIHDIPPGVE